MNYLIAIVVISLLSIVISLFFFWLSCLSDLKSMNSFKGCFDSLGLTRPGFSFRSSFSGEIISERELFFDDQMTKKLEVSTSNGEVYTYESDDTIALYVDYLYGCHFTNVGDIYWYIPWDDIKSMRVITIFPSIDSSDDCDTVLDSVKSSISRDTCSSSALPIYTETREICKESWLIDSMSLWDFLFCRDTSKLEVRKVEDGFVLSFNSVDDFASWMDNRVFEVKLWASGDYPLDDKLESFRESHGKLEASYREAIFNKVLNQICRSKISRSDIGFHNSDESDVRESSYNGPFIISETDLRNFLFKGSGELVVELGNKDGSITGNFRFLSISTFKSWVQDKRFIFKDDNGSTIDGSTIAGERIGNSKDHTFVKNSNNEYLLDYDHYLLKLYRTVLSQDYSWGD